MRCYYSQHGEDYLLEQLFSGKNEGCFVEVGCIDGRRFSNTLHFEEKGWSGLCIEAHGDYINLLERNRPNSKIAHCAVGEDDKDQVVFYANARGSLSTLDKTKEEEFKTKFPHFFSGFKEQIVKKRTLDSIFAEYQLSTINLLSLDIEGYEIQALMGLDLSIYAPEVIIVESDSRLHEHQLDEQILIYSYIKLLKLSQNVIYIKKSALLGTIATGEYVFPLTHTRHPLDTDIDGDTTKEIRLIVSNDLSSRCVLAVKN